MGHADGLSELRSSKDHLLSDHELEVEEYTDDDDEEAANSSEEILYAASFEELASNSVKYVLKKDISSRKLYVTPSEIVYKVSRPSFIPFWGKTTNERHVPLSLVIDVIIEQGCLQSIYGIHTFRVESIARGKAAPVDELQVQGVDNPVLLRKVIVTEAAKVIQNSSKNWKVNAFTGEVESMSRMASLTEGTAVLRSPSKSWKMAGLPRQASVEHRGMVPGELILHKLDEVNKSVKKIELLFEKSQNPQKGN
ncbi:hypothetical protein KPL70_010391 [Citrus sinensis]|uniref:Uncharacterized protein n=1 Tax=Citrus sinensis TaxID=2711 RepID=A0ACB8MRG7_CITSI|nr:hypothetical protein KPL70_010192 [Citrus sinensis]KAH9732782.1 hypothetical protein KPL70_010391 [Citrus sinensis]KAH9788000.1 hypothetical protein KPL71_010769 [Citrus sinensis]